MAHRITMWWDFLPVENPTSFRFQSQKKRNIERSRLRMLRNKRYHEFLPCELVFHHIFPHLTWHFPDYVRNPDEIFSIQFYLRLFGIWVTLQLSYCYRRSSKWVSCAGCWTWDIPFFLLLENGEDRTRDLIVHNLTSCLRRHCEEVLVD